MKLECELRLSVIMERWYFTDGASEPKIIYLQRKYISLFISTLMCRSSASLAEIQASMSKYLNPFCEASLAMEYCNDVRLELENVIALAECNTATVRSCGKLTCALKAADEVLSSSPSSVQFVVTSVSSGVVRVISSTHMIYRVGDDDDHYSYYYSL